MTTGFCSKCHLIRQDDVFGPVTPCACFVEHHAESCRLRIALRSPIAIACEAHEVDECDVCYACSCGVPPERTYVCGDHVFAREMDVGLVPPGKENAP